VILKSLTTLIKTTKEKEKKKRKPKLSTFLFLLKSWKGIFYY